MHQKILKPKGTFNIHGNLISLCLDLVVAESKRAKLDYTNSYITQNSKLHSKTNTETVNMAGPTG